MTPLGEELLEHLGVNCFSIQEESIHIKNDIFNGTMFGGGDGGHQVVLLSLHDAVTIIIGQFIVSLFNSHIGIGTERKTNQKGPNIKGNEREAP